MTSNWIKRLRRDDSGKGEQTGVAGVHVYPSSRFALVTQVEQAGQTVLRCFSSHQDAGSGPALVLREDGAASSVTLSAVSQIEMADSADEMNRPVRRSQIRKPLMHVGPVSETQARQAYVRMRGDLLGHRPARRSPWAMVAVVFLVCVTTLVLLTPTGPSSAGVSAQRAAVQSPVVPMQVPGVAAAAPGTIPAGATLSGSERAMIDEAKGVIPLGAAGTKFYVFSDPNCPYCKEMERALLKTPAGFQAVIIPLGYKSGSREQAAAALCAAKPDEQWRATLLGAAGASPAKACDKGLEQVAQNMALFEKLRLSQTPTMVTPGGLLVSGSPTPAELASILVGAAK